jgi:hypothetical protein
MGFREILHRNILRNFIDKTPAWLKWDNNIAKTYVSNMQPF